MKSRAIEIIEEHLLDGRTLAIRLNAVRALRVVGEDVETPALADQAVAGYVRLLSSAELSALQDDAVSTLVQSEAAFKQKVLDGLQQRAVGGDRLAINSLRELAAYGETLPAVSGELVRALGWDIRPSMGESFSFSQAISRVVASVVVAMLSALVFLLFCALLGADLTEDAFRAVMVSASLGGLVLALAFSFRSVSGLRYLTLNAAVLGEACWVFAVSMVLCLLLLGVEAVSGSAEGVATAFKHAVFASLVLIAARAATLSVLGGFLGQWQLTAAQLFVGGMAAASASVGLIALAESLGLGALSAELQMIWPSLLPLGFAAAAVFARIDATAPAYGRAVATHKPRRQLSYLVVSMFLAVAMVVVFKGYDLSGYNVGSNLQSTAALPAGEKPTLSSAGKAGSKNPDPQWVPFNSKVYRYVFKVEFKQYVSAEVTETDSQDFVLNLFARGSDQIIRSGDDPDKVEALLEEGEYEFQALPYGSESGLSNRSSLSAGELYPFFLRVLSSRGDSSSRFMLKVELNKAIELRKFSRSEASEIWTPPLAHPGERRIQIEEIPSRIYFSVDERQIVRVESSSTIGLDFAFAIAHEGVLIATADDPETWEGELDKGEYYIDFGRYGTVGNLVDRELLGAITTVSLVDGNFLDVTELEPQVRPERIQRVELSITFHAVATGLEGETAAGPTVE